MGLCLLFFRPTWVVLLPAIVSYRWFSSKFVFPEVSTAAAPLPAAAVAVVAELSAAAVAVLVRNRTAARECEQQRGNKR